MTSFPTAPPHNKHFQRYPQILWRDQLIFDCVHRCKMFAVSDTNPRNNVLECRKEQICCHLLAEPNDSTQKADFPHAEGVVQHLLIAEKKDFPPTPQQTCLVQQASFKTSVLLCSHSIRTLRLPCMTEDRHTYKAALRTSISPATIELQPQLQRGRQLSPRALSHRVR